MASIRARRTVRGGVVAGGVAAFVLAAAGGASAHVSVTSTDAKPGGSNATLVFKVPNEESDAATTKVEITLPTDATLKDVTAQAPSGWTAQVAADKVTFSGGRITGDDRLEFPIKVGTLPNTDKLVFKALQTYDNGDVTRWIEVAADGAAEPEHPAPTIDLKNPSAVDDDDDEDHEHAGGDDHAESGTHDDGDHSDGSATPTRVHAGTGGQAAGPGSSGLPLAGPGLALLGLGAAGLGARRLARR